MTEDPLGEPLGDPRAEPPGEPKGGLPGDPDDLGDAAAGGPIDYEPPWREARARVTTAWARGGAATRITLALAVALAAALIGAFLFGLWHVVVGGFLKGNWNAGGFGIALASVAGVLLWIEAAVARRLLPRGPAP